MTDEELLGYAAIHSQTERALFSPEHVRQLTKIIYGEEEARKTPHEWRALHYEKIKDELELGWKNINEQKLKNKKEDKPIKIQCPSCSSTYFTVSFNFEDCKNRKDVEEYISQKLNSDTECIFECMDCGEIINKDQLISK